MKILPSNWIIPSFIYNVLFWCWTNTNLMAQSHSLLCVCTFVRFLYFFPSVFVCVYVLVFVKLTNLLFKYVLHFSFQCKWILYKVRFILNILKANLSLYCCLNYSRYCWLCCLPLFVACCSCFYVLFDSLYTILCFSFCNFVILILCNFLCTSQHLSSHPTNHNPAIQSANSFIHPLEIQG